MALMPDSADVSPLSTLKQWVSRELDDKPDTAGSGPIVQAKQAGTVISVVVVGVVALVGLLIFGEVFDSLPLNDPVFSSGGALEGIPSSIVSGFGDAIGLVPVILLVLLASVVLGVVQNMRMQA